MITIISLILMMQGHMAINDAGTYAGTYGDNRTDFNETVICDENDELICSESTVLCEAKICDFECGLDGSCNNTIFHCKGSEICAVSCVGINSCESSNILCESDECNVYGIGNLSLKKAAVFSIYAETMVECVGAGSCNNAKVNALSYNMTNVSCLGKHSCYDLYFYCPMNLKSEEKQCNLIGTDTGEKVRINVHAYDSWNNINIEGWNPNNILNDSLMICGMNDNCTFGGSDNKNSEWDCHDETSKCSLTYLNDDIHIIICDEYNNCKQKEVKCDFDKKCIVQCNSPHSCQQAVISSGYDTLGWYNIECNGFESCVSSDIICQDNCNITANGESAMFNASVLCEYGEECHIECKNESACSNALIKGSDADVIDIYCENGGCSDINIWCPRFRWNTYGEDNKNCIMQGSGDMHRHLDIYSKYGFKYMDIDEYEAAFIDNGSNIMHCGADYASICTIYSSFVCVCGNEDMSTTKGTNDDMSTTKGSNDDLESELIIIGCTVGVIILIIVAGFGIYCIQQKRKTKYSSIQTEQMTH